MKDIWASLKPALRKHGQGRKTVAQTEEADQSIDQTRSERTTRHPDRTKSKGILETKPDSGPAQWDDEPMARRTGIGFHSGAMDQDSLPGHGPVALRNRLVRGLMLGGVGRGS
jgi:uncharacterized iron-regulated membrane protein